MYSGCCTLMLKLFHVFVEYLFHGRSKAGLHQQKRRIMVKLSLEIKRDFLAANGWTFDDNLVAISIYIAG